MNNEQWTIKTMAIDLIFKQIDDIKSMWHDILKDSSTKRHGRRDCYWDRDKEGDGDDRRNRDGDEGDVGDGDATTETTAMTDSNDGERGGDDGKDEDKKRDR